MDVALDADGVDLVSVLALGQLIDHFLPDAVGLVALALADLIAQHRQARRHHGEQQPQLGEQADQHAADEQARERADVPVLDADLAEYELFVPQALHVTQLQKSDDHTQHAQAADGDHVVIEVVVQPVQCSLYQCFLSPCCFVAGWGMLVVGGGVLDAPLPLRKCFGKPAGRRGPAPTESPEGAGVPYAVKGLVLGLTMSRQSRSPRARPSISISAQARLVAMGMLFLSHSLAI